MIDTTKRIGQFDGLRAVAILLVFLHHSITRPVEVYLHSIDFHYAGYFLRFFTSSGVQLFYVLSGVLLLRPYLHKQKDLKSKLYFKRRIERLYPSYFVVLILTALIFFLVTKYPNWYSESFMMKFNLLNFIEQLPIFHINSPYFNPVLWSLEIEFLFYILIPIIIFILVKLELNKRFYVFILFILIAISIKTQSYIFLHFNFPINIINTFLYYSPCFFGGIVLAKYDFTQKHGYIFLFVGIIYIFLSLFFLPLNTPPSYGLFYAALIILSLTNQRVSSFFNNYYLVWLGERSYSFFIIHYPAINLVNYIIAFFIFDKTVTYFMLTRLFSIIFSIIFTILLFHFIERKKAGKLITHNDVFPFYKKEFDSKNNLNS